MNTSFQGTTETGTDVWLTPPEYVNGLGPFDLDPASPIIRPWDTAAKHYTVIDDGLKQEWQGRVWMNPPYGRKIHLWMIKMVKHANGICLVYASTDVDWFDYVWNADAVLFKKARIKFYGPDGTIPRNAKGQEGSPGKGSVFAAWGEYNVSRLWKANESGLIPGKFIRLK